MNKAEILAKIETIFQKVFNDSTLHITEESNANTVDKWDSLHHITLLSMIQEDFGITLDIDEVISIENIGDIVKILDEKGV